MRSFYLFDFLFLFERPEFRLPEASLLLVRGDTLPSSVDNVYCYTGGLSCGVK